MKPDFAQYGFAYQENLIINLEHGDAYPEEYRQQTVGALKKRAENLKSGENWYHDPVQYSGDFQSWPDSVLLNSCLRAAATASWEWKVRAGTHPI